jgi:AcrR family transcriptional regulator
MVKSADHPGKTEKINAIIEIAQKLFGIFGFERVTMHEIAEELNISKASLYYYFPDKESLYIAVIEKEQGEFLSKITEQMVNIADPSEILREYAVKRLLFFHSLLNLGRLRSESFHNLKADINMMIHNFREKEKDIIIRILDKGTRSGVFSKVDAAGTAYLYLDLLRSLRISIVDKKKEFYLEQEEFNKLMKKTNDFTEIFIKGLRS